MPFKITLQVVHENVGQPNSYTWLGGLELPFRPHIGEDIGILSSTIIERMPEKWKAENGTDGLCLRVDGVRQIEGDERLFVWGHPVEA